MIKDMLNCDYKDGDVAFNLSFDKGHPDHYEQIEKMINMLSECKADLIKYIEENKE